MSKMKKGIISTLLTKDDIMELFTPSEDEEEPDGEQLEIEFIYD